MSSSVEAMVENTWESNLHRYSWTGAVDTLNESLAVVDGELDMEEHGVTPLYVAALRGHTLCCTSLLKANADADNGGSSGAPPLYCAAARGNEELVECLLAHGASCALESPEQGCGPIHIAADKGHDSILMRLLDCRVDVDAPSTRWAMTALHHASHCGRASTVTLLLDAKACVDAITEAGSTALMLAAHQGHVDVVNALVAVERDAPPPAIHDGVSPLHVAAAQGHTAVVEALLRARADPNAAYPPYHHTPLHLCAAKGHRETAEVLLRAGAQVNALNKPGATPLRLAATNESELIDRTSFRHVAALLLDNNADCNVPNEHGNTALHSLVAQGGLRSNIEYLLSRGAAPTAPNAQGLSAYNLASTDDVRACLAGYIVSGEAEYGTAPSEAPQRTSVETEGNIRPRWQPDTVSRCTQCESTFSIFNRRHHCRNCGKIFCGGCTSYWTPIPALGYANKVRCCAPCYARLHTTESSALS